MGGSVHRCGRRPLTAGTPPIVASLDGAAVCVTGGAGFIGSHLCAALVEHGARVRVIDDLSNGRRSNLDDLDVDLVEGSVLDGAALARAVDGAAFVFHLAAIASVPRSVEEPLAYLAVNTEGTVRVLEAARASGAERVIFSASSSAYGDQPGLPRVETMPPDTRSPYAAAKVGAEHFVRAYAQCYDLDAVSLRYFNIFGPRQRFDSPYAAVIPRWVRAFREGATPVVYGDGKQTRDFTYVANAVHANLLAAAAPDRLGGAVINVATGRRLSLLELLAQIAVHLGVPPACTHADPRAGEVQHSLADLTRARDLIGYEPIVEFETGLDATIRWLLAQDD